MFVGKLEAPLCRFSLFVSLPGEPAKRRLLFTDFADSARAQMMAGSKPHPFRGSANTVRASKRGLVAQYTYTLRYQLRHTHVCALSAYTYQHTFVYVLAFKFIHHILYGYA